MTKTIRSRALLSAAITAMAPAALLTTTTAVMTGSAYAQSSVGSIFGTVAPGEEVTVSNPSTGFRVTTTADGRGRFAVYQLQPGTYNVSGASGSATVDVRVGTGTPAYLGSDEVVVIGTSGFSPLDVSSVESTTVFSAEQLRNLPIPQDISAVALLAPGTVQAGHPNFGGLVSVGGSSVAENGYYINGFDVTNIRKFLSYANLPFQAIAQEQVKTGGYGAEYGRSLGGVINLVTERGTNDWKFGGSVVWSPEKLSHSGKDVLSNDPTHYSPTAPNHYFVYRSANEASRLKYAGYVSGPIIEDRLFFYGIAEMRRDTNDSFGRQSSQATKNTSPQGLIKIDANLFEGHSLELTGIWNRMKTSYLDYNTSSLGVAGYYPDEHIGVETPYTVKTGGKVGIAKYTGRITDNFTLSAQWGYLDSLDGYTQPETIDPAAALCPRAFDSTVSAGSVVYTGCWNTAQLFIPDPNGAPDEDIRKAVRADAEWLLGDHTIRFGFDREKFVSSHRGQVYTGGIYWRHFLVGAAETSTSATCGIGNPGRCVNGVLVAQNQTYARSWVYETNTSSYAIINQAFYLEDSWSITPEFVLYAGMRLESFENRNGEGVAFVDPGYEWAPRLGFSWDVNGDSSLKLFGTWGRYYIPMAANTNIRVSGIETLTEEYFLSTGFNSMTGFPTGLGGQIGQTNVNGSTSPPAPNSIASANLSPMYQDELIVGAQKMFSDDLMIGVRGIYRKLKSGMDDHCSLQPFQSWADDNGYGGTIDLSSISHCHIINPGQDVVLEFDADGTGPALWTVDAEYFQLPAISRKYKAVEAFWDYRGEKLTLNGSYTMSWLKGNSEGYVNTDLGQTDAGLTQDWDNYLFTLGAYGYLNNDRRHAFKMFGVYDFTDEFSMAANLLVQSGRPISCLGYIDLSDPGVGIDAGDLAFYSASSFNCTNPDTLVKEIQQRGSFGRTPWSWDIDLSAAYRPSFGEGKLAFRADIFNVFNNQTVQRVSQTSEIGSASTPLVNVNFLNHIDYQTPRSVRFTVSYDF